MVALLKAPGVREATRQCRVTATPARLSFSTSALTVTRSEGCGTGGVSCTSSTIGGRLVVKEPLAKPGVPPGVAEGSQFWPELLFRDGFRNSSEAPAPSASFRQIHPLAMA